MASASVTEIRTVLVVMSGGKGLSRPAVEYSGVLTVAVVWLRCSVYLTTLQQAMVFSFSSRCGNIVVERMRGFLFYQILIESERD